jgi:hypothetical protein
LVLYSLHFLIGDSGSALSFRKFWHVGVATYHCCNCARSEGLSQGWLELHGL